MSSNGARTAEIGSASAGTRSRPATTTPQSSATSARSTRGRAAKRDARDAAATPPRRRRDRRYDLDGGIVGAEDCLFLNVYAPQKKAAPRPVMVWVHGGGLTSGSAPTYDFKRLASDGDVVIVSIQYRRGVLFFAAPTRTIRVLAAARPRPSTDYPRPRRGAAATPPQRRYRLSWAGWLAVPGSLEAGNWGLLDQIESLRWVRRHASVFGGDPGQVTVFGQSAGGTSVLLLAAAPPAAGLFRRAIAQSPWWEGPQLGGVSANTAADLVWESCWCDVVDCNATGSVLDALKKADARDLTQACGWTVAVVADGHAVPNAAMGELCEDRDPFHEGLELLVGSNEEEYGYWLMDVAPTPARTYARPRRHLLPSYFGGASTEYPRRGRGAAATRGRAGIFSPRGMPAPRTIHVVAAAPPRPAAAPASSSLEECQLHGLSTSWPRRRRDLPP